MIELLTYILIGIVVGYIIIQIWQLTVIVNYKSEQTRKIDEAALPHISIWIACRNEEENLPKCLDSVLSLNYPSEKIQILIGNDQSEDGTKQIADSYAEKHPNIQVIDIIDDDSGLKAKARVMAQLDKYAKGDFYLITDADVQVSSNWVQGLLSNINESIGVASGTTMVKSDGVDGLLQEIDWVYFMGLLNVISYTGVPATAVGNNMIISNNAYWETGGYSSIRFSITEDYKLYQQICDKGWKWNNIMNPDVLALSEKTSGWKNLLHQRKRWLSGGKELPWYWWVLFGVYGGFYFCIPILFSLNLLKITSLLWSIKLLLQVLQINGIYRHLGVKKPLLYHHLAYEIYLFALTISTAVFFLLPTKTVWKNRKYQV